MKKLLVFVLALLFVLTLGACGKKTDKKKNSKATESTSSEFVVDADQHYVDSDDGNFYDAIDAGANTSNKEKDEPIDFDEYTLESADSKTNSDSSSDNSVSFDTPNGSKNKTDNKDKTSSTDSSNSKTSKDETYENMAGFDPLF